MVFSSARERGSSYPNCEDDMVGKQKAPGEGTGATYYPGGRKKQSKERELVKETVGYRSCYMPSSQSTETSTLGLDF